jgi:hypothetical protein
MNTHADSETLLFHDFTLRSYEVSDYGRTITLDLLTAWEPVLYSKLQFRDVESYRFTHTGGAILIDIDEVPFVEAVRELGIDFAAELRQHGGLHVSFPTDSEYGRHFAAGGYKTWLIASAIGFLGMVVAKNLVSLPSGNVTA